MPTDENDAQVPCVCAWPRTSRPPACGSCARSRRRARSRPRRTRSATRSRPCRGRWRRSRPSPAAGCSIAAGTASTLTPAGARLLPRAIRILDELDAALRETRRRAVAVGPVRLGAFATAAAGLVPRGAGGAAAGAEGHAARGDHARADPRAARGHARPRDPRPDAAVPAAGRRVARAGAHDALRARAGRRRAGRPPARGRPRGRGRAARGPGLGREPVRRRRLAARRLAGAGGAPGRPLRRARLARQAPDRRRRAGDHDARPGRRSTCCPTASRSSPCAASRRRRGAWCWRAGPDRSTGAAARVADALIAAARV